MMTLLRAVRAHAMKIAVLALLSIPALGALRAGARQESEQRALAPLPALPASAAAALAWPAAATAWVNDHFGYRSGMIKLNNRVRHALFREFPSGQLVGASARRTFLAAHTAASPPYLALSQVCANMAPPAPDAAARLRAVFAVFQASGLHPRLLIAPSAAVVHSADLPATVRANCARDDTPVAALLAQPALRDLRADVYYPLAQMRAIKDRAMVYPHSWFHWSGDGLDEVARLSVAYFWDRHDPAPPLATRRQVLRSDVAHLSPGVDLRSDVVEPDLAASGIAACTGPHCLAALGDAGAVLGDVSSYRNPAAPARRLVILSDSFGAFMAPWYARYYRDVAHVSVKQAWAMTPEQARRVSAALLSDPAATDLLLLFHDGGVVQAPMSDAIAGLRLGQ